MSHSIQINLNKTLSTQKFLKILDHLDFKCSGDNEDWPLNIYIHGVSSRSTRVEPDGAGLELCINILASEADWDLALRIIEALAPHSDGTVSTEDRGDVPISELRQVYPEETWIIYAESGFRALKHIISKERGPMQIPGPNRSLYLGEQLLHHLDNYLGLVEALRKIQYLEFDTEPGILGYQDDPENQRFSLMGEWVAVGSLFLSKLDFLLVEVEIDDFYSVPIEEFKRLFSEQIEYVDECQFFIKEFDASAWIKLVSLARQLQIRP